MAAFLDARSIPAGTVLAPDLAIVGGGPAGISLALALASTKLKIVLLESGGMNFDPRIQKMYAGDQIGVTYTALDAGRLRFLGGATNHWGGWCRPLDALDFQQRDWVPHSGWPFPQSALAPFYPRAQKMVEAGPWLYDGANNDAALGPDAGPKLNLGKGGVYTSWFQFSKTRGGVLPTPFGERYAGELKATPNVTPYLHANVTGVRLDKAGRQVTRLDVTSLNGNRFSVTPRAVVLAAGGMENARILLASNDVMPNGVGNQNDLVGRFFADNPIPRDVATLVVFGGKLGRFYHAPNQQAPNGAILRAAFAPTAAFAREKKAIGSLVTVEQPLELDETGKAAVITTALALGVDASNARSWSLGCGMELMPDPERRLTLTGEKDALGLPRLKLAMRLPDSDFARFRETLAELGRQLLESRAGMLRLNLSSRSEWMAKMDWGHHHLGTTRMHVDPKQGVVDADARVHGLGNLYIAGSSVFPTYGASNPTLNLIALTLKLADHLKTVIT